MFPRIWQRVVRGNYRSAPAVVNGYARFAVIGQTYPGMIAHPGAVVSGVVYFDVDADDIALLDAFEGQEYRRDTLQAQLENGAMVTASAYLYRNKSGLTAAAWDPERFQIERFMERHCRQIRTSNN